MIPDASNRKVKKKIVAPLPKHKKNSDGKRLLDDTYKST